MPNIKPYANADSIEMEDEKLQERKFFSNRALCKCLQHLLADRLRLRSMYDLLYSFNFTALNLTNTKQNYFPIRLQTEPEVVS